VRSDCQATGAGGKKKIEAAFEEVKGCLKADEGADWTCTYYQFANRIATLYFLQKHLIPARLLFLYFYGDIPGRKRECPESPEGWHETLKRVDAHIGLPESHTLIARIHKLFVPVRRPA
jgi:hypothetical protein